MTAETQSAFARRISRDKSHITRLKQAGRLVMTDDGLVDVERSIARLEATNSTEPRHDAVREYWDGQRSPPDAPPMPESATTTTIENIGVKTKFENLRKLQAEADKVQMERDKLRGELVDRREVERALTGAVAVILGQVENMPDRIVPQIHGVDDVERVRARIKDEMESLCRRVSHELGRLSEDAKEQAA